MSVPEKKFRSGGLCVSIWKNETQTEDGQKKEYHTISMERGYKDKQGVWKSTNSLRVMDLPKAALLLSKAFEYLVVTNQDTETLVGAEEERIE